MRRVFVGSLTPAARMGMNDNGGRPFVEARALLLLMLAALATSMVAMVLASPPAQAETYTVTITNDSGAGSLRQAINAANATTGVGDTIVFAPALDGQTITLGSQLPNITDQAGLTIDGSEIGTNITVSGNDQHRVFYVGDGAKLTLNRLTVANGHTSGAGAGIANYGGTLTVSYSTIAENKANVQGSGIQTYYDGTADLWNTIVANNHSPAGDSNCSGTITDHGHNLDSGDSCDFSWDTDNLNSYSNTDPFLGDLAYNGGPTKTMALLAGSVATTKDDGGFINVSFNPNAVDPYGAPLQFDQRGAGFARIAEGAVDIGAYEYQGAVGSEPPPAEEPEDKQACKRGDFREFGFKNQGQCIKAVDAKN